MSDTKPPNRDATTIEEIERKFLLNGPPDVPAEAERLVIEQGYLPTPTADGGAHIEGRLRRITKDDGTVRHTHSVKKGEGLIRRETTRELTAEEFADLWPKTDRRRLHKVRRRLPLGEVLWEIDHIEELNVDLAEVEIPTAETEVEIPAWLETHIIREVTGDPAFTNYELALKAIAARP